MDLFYCIGAGAYGRVWLARDKTGQWRAVKVVHRKRFGEHERAYLRELEAIKSYAPVSHKHECLLKIFHVGWDDLDQYFYYVMELADPTEPGPDFEQGSYQPRTLKWLLLKQSALPVGQCISTGLALATALNELHSRGLLHRDIKPSNIVFVDDRPKLADIGLLAKLGDAFSFVGTEGYIPPEGPGKPAADVFALGKVLYLASTGFEPGKFPEPPIANLEEQEGKKWFELNVVLVKACKSSPELRYQNAGEMRQDLLLLEAGESLLHRDRWKQHVATLRRYSAVGVVAMAALIALLLMYRSRAAEQTRGRDLRDAQIVRLGLRASGWSTNHAARIELVRQKRTDAELRNEAATAFAGLDLRPGPELFDVGGSSIAFGRGGQVLFGGLSDQTAHFWQGGRQTIVELAQAGDGPVAFDAHDRPIQFASIGESTFGLRDLRSGEVLREFNLPGEPATGYDGHPVLALTPDLSRAAAAVKLGNKGGFAVWNTATGEQLGATDELVTATAIAPDGTCVATGHEDGQIIVRTLPIFDEIARFHPGRTAIHALAFGTDPAMPDSSSTNRIPCPWLLAVGDSAAKIVIYEISTGHVVSTLRGSAYDVHALAFRSDGTILASAGRENPYLWDVATGQPLLRMISPYRALPLDYARALAFSADDRQLAVAMERTSLPASVSIWAIEDGRGVQTLYGLAAQVERVWWSQDSHRVAALADDWELGIWEMPSGKLTHRIQVPSGASADNAALAFHPDKPWVAFASAQNATLYDLCARRVLRRWTLPPGYCDSLRFEGDSRLLFLHSETAAAPAPSHLWALYDLLSTNSGVAIATQPDTNWVTYGTALPSGGEWFLVWGGPRDDHDHRSEIRGIKTGTAAVLWRLPSQLDFHACRVTFDPATTLFAYTPKSDSDLSQVHRLPGLELVAGLNGLPEAISPSGKLFSTASDYNGWLIYGLKGEASAARLAMDFRPKIQSQFSPDGTYLAMPTAEGRLLVAKLVTVLDRLRVLGWTPQ